MNTDPPFARPLTPSVPMLGGLRRYLPSHDAEEPTTALRGAQLPTQPPRRNHLQEVPVRLVVRAAQDSLYSREARQPLIRRQAFEQLLELAQQSLFLSRGQSQRSARHLLVPAQRPSEANRASPHPTSTPWITSFRLCRRRAPLLARLGPQQRHAARTHAGRQVWAGASDAGRRRQGHGSCRPDEEPPREKRHGVHRRHLRGFASRADRTASARIRSADFMTR